MLKRFTSFAAVALALAAAASAQNPIHVTYLWHMHQPNYYPYMSVNDVDNSGQFNFSVRSVHDQRTGPYGEWPKNAVQQSADRNMPHAGVQVSFSGSLMENLNGIWGTGWREHYRWARNGLRTARGNPRLDLVGFAHHHSLMPLTSRESMIMQIRLHKEAYWDNWGVTDGSYSKGFFPPESSFAMHMVPALVNQGIEWVLVDNGHFDRTLDDFPWSPASSIRPNRADQRNGSIAGKNSEWTQLNNVWAPTKVAAPWSYQPHRIRYVDPNSDPANPTVHSMIAVPAARYEGNENGRGGYGSFKPQNVWGDHLARNNDPNRPMLIVCHSDGDNFGMLNADAYHGQHGQFLDMVQGNASFAHTSVQDYLDLYPVPAHSPYIHVEPGSWIGIDGGTPFFEKWVENNARDGEHPDLWSWSVLVAALNRVLHAENLEGNFSANDVRWGIGNDTAKAWRNYLVAETSCYWYWDFDRANPWDGNVTRAANMAVGEANKVIGRHANVDRVGPSIFHPQRPIWNPGGKHWNETENQPSDFEVWTFVDDVSGVESVNLKWRVADWTWYANLNDFAQELYAHSPGKNGPWNTVSMGSGVWYPSVQGPKVPNPAARAKRYAATVSGQNNALISYYVEATDTKGNVSRSEIFHVWVGDDTVGPNPNPRVEFDPPAPDGCNPVTIKYRKSTSPLGNGPIYAHVGRNGWQDVVTPSPLMTDSGDFWTYVYNVPAGTALINVVFKNDANQWDNNGGMDWSVAVANCSTNGGVNPGPAVWTTPENPDGCDPVMIHYNPSGRNLASATEVFIHVGRNGWQDVVLPNPAMTRDGNAWTYVYAPPPGTTNVNVVFNNGATWDNNSDANWNFAVANCPDQPLPPIGISITNPPANAVVGNAVSAFSLSGTAHGVPGPIAWSNSLTGATGSIAAADSWSLPNLPLGVGPNVFTLRSSLALPGGIFTNAFDSAADPAYAANWNSGANGGIGFGPWTLNGAEGGAGHFTALPGFGFWSHEGGHLAEALRPLDLPLSVGQTFSVRMKNGWIWEQGGSVGIALRNASGESLWQLYFNGGDSTDTVTGHASDIGWTDAGIDVAFTLTAPNAYSVDVHPVGSAVRTYAGTIDGQIAEFRAWSYNNGTEDEFNSNRDFFVDGLKITSVSAGGIQYFSDTVTITRQSGGALPDAPEIRNLNLAPVGDANGLRFGLSESISGAQYGVWFTPTLHPTQNWQLLSGSLVSSTGGAIDLSITNGLLATNFFRIGVIAP